MTHPDSTAVFSLSFTEQSPRNSQVNFPWPQITSPVHQRCRSIQIKATSRKEMEPPKIIKMFIPVRYRYFSSQIRLSLLVSLLWNHPTGFIATSQQVHNKRRTHYYRCTTIHRHFESVPEAATAAGTWCDVTCSFDSATPRSCFSSRNAREPAAAVMWQTATDACWLSMRRDLTGDFINETSAIGSEGRLHYSAACLDQASL